MDINFKSFSLSPSDHECQEGDLASVHNLVNEDGALKPIQQPEVIAHLGFPSQYAVEDTRFYVHEVDTDSLDEDDNKNYIAVIGNGVNKVLWCNNTEGEEPETEGEKPTLSWEEIDGLCDGDFKVNAVTFTGRIINFIGDREQKWAMWKGSSYLVVSLDDFKYKLDIHSESVARNGNSVTIGSEYVDLMEIQYVNAGTTYETFFDLGSHFGTIGNNTLALGLSAEGVRAILDGLDADLTQKISNDDTLHKQISFGFVAVRLYDGQHIMLSDLFVLGGTYTWKSIRLRVSSTSGLTAITNSSLHRHSMKIQMQSSETLSSLIQGVDVYLTAPSCFKKTDKGYRFGEGMTLWDGQGHDITLTLDNLTDKELYSEIDNLTFHHAMFITREEMDASVTSPVTLKSTTETESALSLADFFRSKHGGNVATNYNGRLNIGDFVESLSLDDATKIEYTFAKNYGPSDTAKAFVTWNSINVPALYNSTTETYSFQTATILMAVDYVDSYGNSHRAYSKRNSFVPLSPIIMLPLLDVTSIDIAVHDGDNLYYNLDGIKLHSSETGTWSYVTHRRNGLLSFWSRRYYEASSGSFSPGGTSQNMAIVEGGEFNINTATSMARYNTLDSSHTEGPSSTTYHYRSRIAVSEADNPFVFSSAKAITVGNGTVLALAAPTQPISQGQAGQTPLVAFTSEGIYPLFVNQQDGSFKATQPGPRDVIIKDGDGNYNVESVVSLDDAIVFASSRGLMVYAGSQTKCISDSLRGFVFGNSLPSLSSVMTAISGETCTSDLIKTYAPLTDLESFLASCRILYDYTGQRLLLYSPNTTKVLVYSLRSGAWGATRFNYVKSLNSYPEALAIGTGDNDYHLVNAHNSKESATIPVHFISRPLGLGDPNTMKRIATAIIRGYFQKSDIKSALYGSRDLRHWFLINTSVDHYLRNRMGTPYKYFRIVAGGNLTSDETIFGVSLDASGSITNQMR